MEVSPLTRHHEPDATKFDFDGTRTTKKTNKEEPESSPPPPKDSLVVNINAMNYPDRAPDAMDNPKDNLLV